MRIVRPGYIASTVKRLLGLVSGDEFPGKEFTVDQFQSNHAYSVHQLRVRIAGDATPYRVIIAPADAPVFIGCCPADQHFLEPLATVESEGNTHA